MTAPTLAPRLFGSGNVVHDVVEWKGPEQPSHTYTWGVTRCGMRGKTYDVEMWRRGEAAPCKHCEARRSASPPAATWKRQTLPDGRVVEWVWGDDAGEALDVGPGHRRINVTMTVDGDVVTIPVVLTPEQIADAMARVQ